MKLEKGFFATDNEAKFIKYACKAHNRKFVFRTRSVFNTLSHSNSHISTLLHIRQTLLLAFSYNPASMMFMHGAQCNNAYIWIVLHVARCNAVAGGRSSVTLSEWSPYPSCFECECVREKEKWSPWSSGHHIRVVTISEWSPYPSGRHYRFCCMFGMSVSTVKTWFKRPPHGASKRGR